MRFRRLLVAVTLVVGALPSVIASSSMAATLTTPKCAPTRVSLSATANQASYSLGDTVHVTVALHNHSATSCSYATGTFSPNFVLTNAAGRTVWGSCWFGGGPAPCAYYLIHRTLAPGATYRERLTWDQRTGHPEAAVPAGVYTFRVNIVGLAGHATTHIVLTRS